MSKRAVVGVTTVGAAVGLVSSLITTLFLVLPNLVPSTRYHVEIKKVRIEPEVTLEEYLSHPSVRRAVDDIEASYPEPTRRVLQQAQPRLRRVGTVVHYEIEVQGLRGGSIAGRWILFDADTGRRLGSSADLDPLPLAFEVGKSEMDLGSWESWVDTASTRGSTFFVRVEVYAEDSGSRITFEDSAPFAAAGSGSLPGWVGPSPVAGPEARSDAPLPAGIADGDVVETGDGLLWFVWAHTKTRLWVSTLPETFRVGRDVTGGLTGVTDPVQGSPVLRMAGPAPGSGPSRPDGVFVGGGEAGVVHPVLVKRVSSRVADGIPTAYGEGGWSPALR